MMKATIIIFFYGFFLFNLNAQNIDKIKKQKVFFVLFDAKDEYMRKIDLSRNKRDSIYNYIYYFYNKEEKKRV